MRGYRCRVNRVGYAATCRCRNGRGAGVRRAAINSRVAAATGGNQQRGPSLPPSIRSNMPTSGCPDGGAGLFDLGSANGERGAKPPRREGCRLPHHSQNWASFRRREFHEALFDADSFEDLPGKW